MALSNSRRQVRAWIGDAILLHHTRAWCVEHLARPSALTNVVVSNENLAAYAKDRLMEPQWTGTDVEAYIATLEKEYGRVAAAQLVANLCEWTYARMQQHKYYIPQRLAIVGLFIDGDGI